MNWDQVEGKWKQSKGALKEKWGKLTDSDLDVIAGKRDQLIGRIQELYGLSKEQAQREVEDYIGSMPAANDVEEPTTPGSKARRAGQP
jgi:uncharacterized protein YjbJ (UPF0337 family)